MDLIAEFKAKARKDLKRIVLPEGDDDRILPAAKKIVEEGVARPIVLGPEAKITEEARKLGLDASKVKLIDPATSPDLGRYTQLYSRKRDGLPEAVSRRLMKRPMMFGAMMVAVGDADGMVGGVSCPTARVIEAGGLTIGYQPGVTSASSFFVMVVPECLGEKDKVLVFADCAVNTDPTTQQLAEIAVVSGRSAKSLLGIEPSIAMLSFSTKGSAEHPHVTKVVEATRIAQSLAPEFKIDGELQADSALVPRVAQRKVKESNVAGRANVLVFPDLDAGNIAYKLTQYLGNARAYGPILQGFAKPISDMSRGASVDDLVGVTAIIAVLAQASIRNA
jgi:phosphate acetyltransferase